jgi:hypothetical protein
LIFVKPHHYYKVKKCLKKKPKKNEPKCAFGVFFVQELRVFMWKTEKSANTSGHNPAANASGPETIWDAAKEVYDVQSVKVANSQGGQWIKSKFQNIKESDAANLFRFSHAVNHG